MDRNTLIGLLLIMAVLFGWTYFTQPSKEEKERLRQQQDSIARVQEAREMKKAIDKTAVISTDAFSETGTKSDSALQQDAVSFFGDFAPFAMGERKFYTVENDLLKVTFSNLGGRIYSVELKKYKTFDSLPLVLFSGDSTEFGLNFFAKNRSISTNQLYFNQLEESNANTDSSITVVYALNVSDTQYIKYRYTFTPGEYMVGFDIDFKGMDNLITTNTGYLTLYWKSFIPSLEKGQEWEKQNTSVFYKFYQDNVENLNMRSESADENLTTKLKWISYKQQFFNSTLIADDYFVNAVVKSEPSVDQNYLKYLQSEISLPYSSSKDQTIPMSFYFGPNKYKILKQYDIDLQRLVELGGKMIRWFNVGVIIPLFNWLGKYIGNYGLIILLMTIIIKIIIFPFTYKSYMSSAKMKALKPEVDKLSEKFPKKEDAMKKQQATMDLYKKVGVSPMGGCLPLLFQMPILLAMFRFFPNSIELRQESFLWADDLSSYDSIFHLPFNIPFYGDHISLFALLMTIVNFIYMKTNDQMNASNQQMPGMKMMMYMMPIMMLFWLNSYAAALSYYYFVSLLITIIQTWLIRKTVDDAEILAKLQAAQASKKPVKKSKWQQRLEDMAKQRGYQPPKR